MGVVIIGRIMDERGVRLLEDNELGIYEEDPVVQFLNVKNGLVQSYLDYLTTPVKYEGIPCWSIPDIDAFIVEAERLLPKRDLNMDALDAHCAEQVLNHLPYTLLSLKREAALDKQQNRFSHYFIRIAG